MSNALNWFEIPVTDLARAKAFYARMLQVELRDETLGGLSMAILPYGNGGVGGSLIVGEPHVPSTQGTIVYLGAGDDLPGTLNRAEAGGGKRARTRLGCDVGPHHPDPLLPASPPPDGRRGSSESKSNSEALVVVAPSLPAGRGGGREKRGWGSEGPPRGGGRPGR
jgi:predicted enzyme related to lactoylglutathione lyase